MQEPLGYMILEEPNLAQDTKIVGKSSVNNRSIGEGTLQEANETNRNGRDYDKQDLFPALKDPRLKELLNAKSLFAEDGHPLDKTLARQQTIYRPLRCASYLSIWTEGNFIKSRFKGTNNQLGEEFDMDLKDGVIPAFSLRALGTVQNKNGKVFVKNLRIITWDVVVYPSHPRAYMTKIVSESANMAKDAGVGANQRVYDENWKGELSPILTEQAIDFIKQESTNIKLFTNVFETLGNKVSLCEGGTKLQLVTANGSVARINIENYITNEIMNYCTR